MKNKKIGFIGNGPVAVCGIGPTERIHLEDLAGKEHGLHPEVMFVDDNKNIDAPTIMAQALGRGKSVVIVTPPEIPTVTWETPILEITQHPYFLRELESVILRNVSYNENSISKEFHRLFPRFKDRAEKVIQEYYKITLKQSKCSSRMRALIERIVKATCVTLIQKYNDGKRPAQAEKTAGNS